MLQLVILLFLRPDDMTINYSTTAAISIALGPGIDPSFVIRPNFPQLQQT
ncbi:hypothetical protein [Priestia taiwanensis]|nr:hypothetical protein [Priestia taiwanensis]